MTNYPEPAPGNEWRLNEAAAHAPLDLPIDPDFVSLPPRVELPAMLRRIEEHLAWRNGRPGEAARRLAEKIHEEFVL